MPVLWLALIGLAGAIAFAGAVTARRRRRLATTRAIDTSTARVEDDARALAVLGQARLSLQSGDLDRATGLLTDAEHVSQSRNVTARCHLLRAELRRLTGDFAAAEADRQAMLHDPLSRPLDVERSVHQAACGYEVARLRALRGQGDLAVRALDDLSVEWLRRDGHAVRAEALRSWAAALTGDTGAAEESRLRCRQLLDDAPLAARGSDERMVPDVFLHLALADYERKEFASAGKSLEEWRAAAPAAAEMPEGLYYLGLCHAALGDRDAACAAWEEAASRGSALFFARLAADELSSRTAQDAACLDTGDIVADAAARKRFRTAYERGLQAGLKFSAPVHPETLSAFEHTEQITLPPAYRHFLTRFGNAGYGPDGSLPCLLPNTHRHACELWNDPARVREPFPLTDDLSWAEDAEEFYREIDDLDVEEHDRRIDESIAHCDAMFDRFNDLASRGTLLLGYDDDGDASFIIVNGDAYGEVWMLASFAGNDGSAAVDIRRRGDLTYWLDDIVHRAEERHRLERRRLANREANG